VRRVYREHCACPAAWGGQVVKALRDHAEFLRLSAEFERFGLNSKVRRTGFSTFAPDVVFRSIWGRHKEVIAKMSHRKCVYCEAPINAPRAAHVEHFKPKSLFPSLAYEWTNYFLGCSGCNGAKNDKWPKRGGYLRPDHGDPSRHFVFAEDGTVKAASPGSAADRMLDDFDLKRIWLSDERKQNIEKMIKLLNEAVRLFNAGHDPEAKRLARTVLEGIETPETAYSAALTQCFSRAWESVCPGVKV
jgi:uncharacterized protein (TIGR02646 family)